MNDPVNTAKNGVALLGEIMKAAGDNPDVKEAGANLGQTALTIAKTINNVLLPLAAVNFAFDKARRYFTEDFQEDFSAKTSAIPADQLIEPKASIAGPALQGLAFTHEEPNLKEMYLSLLATSMDERIAAEAHPAFVEIIKQLTSEEAALLRNLLCQEGTVAVAEIRVTTDGQKGWRTLERHLINAVVTASGEQVENPRQAAMIDNWVRLGLVDVDYNKWLAGDESYAWVEKRPEYLRLKAQHESKTTKLSFGRGVITRSSLGIQFARAVGLL